MNPFLAGARRKRSAADAASPSTSVFACDYKGWEMLKKTFGGAPLSRTDLAEEAKRAANNLLLKKKDTRRPATVQVGPGKGLVVTEKGAPGKKPLLSAPISTIISVFVDSENGTVMILARVHDKVGRLGVGCDVLQLQRPGKSGQDKQAVSKRFARALSDVADAHHKFKNQKSMRRSKIKLTDENMGDFDVQQTGEQKDEPESIGESTLIGYLDVTAVE